MGIFFILLYKAKAYHLMPTKKCPNCGFKQPKTTRASNAYNDFVRETMHDPAVQALPSAHRMQAVAALWKRRSPTEVIRTDEDIERLI